MKGEDVKVLVSSGGLEVLPMAGFVQNRGAEKAAKSGHE
jgi:hypothetical protein